jgi:translation initiation factor IF-2
MPEEKTSLRIPKAAIEFNVSQERIIDILTKHGFEIKSPSAKLSAEMYDCLLGELAKDKMVKEKSGQMVPPKAKKEEAKAEEAEAAHDDKGGGHVIIHTTGIQTVQTPATHLPGVKEVGKMSLEDLKKPSKSKTSKKKEEPSVASEPEMTDENPQETPAAPQETPVTETPVATTDSEPAQQEEKVQEVEHIEKEVPHLAGPSILGTMDLDALKPKKKSSSKSKKGQKKESAQPKQEKAEAVKPAPKPEPAPEQKPAPRPVVRKEPQKEEVLYISGHGANGRVWGHITMKGNKGRGTVTDEHENALTVTCTRQGEELICYDQNSRQYIFRL